MTKPKNTMPADFLALVVTFEWLEVLAAPHVYCALQRQVEPGYLTRLLDIWIAYVDRGDVYMGNTVPFDVARPDPERSALARKLRALLEAWTPPELPAEITETARVLLAAEGFEKPHPSRGPSWNDFAFPVDDPTRTVDSFLLWPERLYEILPKDETP